MSVRDGESARPTGGLTALGTYLRSIRRFPLLTASGEQRLAVRSRQGSESAWKGLVQANLRLVVKIALEFRTPGIPLEDLVSEGNIGLMEAARRYDPTRGVRFAAYASWWIRKYILTAIHRHRLYGSAPIPAGRAETGSGDGGLGTHASGTNRKSVMYLWNRIVSFEEFPSTGEDRNTLDWLARSREPAPDDLVNETQVARVLRSVIDMLPGRERGILESRYGLGGAPPKSLQAIGEAMGFTREWVRQLESRAIQRARRLLESRRFRA